MAMFIAIALPSLAQAAERGGLTAYADEPAPATAETPAAGEEGPIPSAAGKAMLVNGRAIAPRNAPLAVRQVIAAANKIRTHPLYMGRRPRPLGRSRL